MKKVMLVEDDATMRNLLKTLLELEGFQVVMHTEVSINGIARQAEEEQPAAMILDVNLRTPANEKVDGIEVMKNMRAQPGLKDICVMMVSGMDLKENCLEAGANGFLLKPYMPDDLINWLKSHTG